jgi:hypothetical protein
MKTLLIIIGSVIMTIVLLIGGIALWGYTQGSDMVTQGIEIKIKEFIDKKSPPENIKNALFRYINSAKLNKSWNNVIVSGQVIKFLEDNEIDEKELAFLTKISELAENGTKLDSTQVMELIMDTDGSIKKLPPFYERVKTAYWEYIPVDMEYKGELPIKKKTLGMIDGSINGLSFNPNGRIAYSHGKGMNKEMKICYWEKGNNEIPIVDLKYRPEYEDSGKKRMELESKGYFWYFAGPVAFDANGTAYFSIGRAGSNGIHKVLSNNPVNIQNLYPVDATTSLQIPFFDSDYLYSTSGNGIIKYPIQPIVENSDRPKPWFTFNKEDVLIDKTLIISPDQILITFSFNKYQINDDKDKVNTNYEEKTILFDKHKKAFWLISSPNFGASAISWDGKKLIYADEKENTLNEFSFDFDALNKQ